MKMVKRKLNEGDLVGHATNRVAEAPRAVVLGVDVAAAEVENVRIVAAVYGRGPQTATAARINEGTGIEAVVAGTDKGQR